MPPPKKAAKKAPKKGVKHHHGKHGKDLRRAFEHLGRVEVLQRALKSPSKFVDALATMAQQQLKKGEHKDAADLLRGAEHLLFASLVGEHSQGAPLSSDLQEAIVEQFHDLARKAEEHWADAEARPAMLSTIYKSSRKSADEAYANRAFHKALEFMRGAEALAHVDNLGALELDAGDDGEGKLTRSTR
jgi:hypothetical protein